MTVSHLPNTGSMGPNLPYHRFPRGRTDLYHIEREYSPKSTSSYLEVEGMGMEEKGEGRGPCPPLTNPPLSKTSSPLVDRTLPEPGKKSESGPS